MRNSARIFVFMLVCIVMTGACMISFAGDAAGSDVPRFFALVIGNGKYLAEDMEPLPETATDAAAMKTALENMNHAWTVAEAYNIKGCEFVPAMEEAFRDASEGDVCLFYYTGHGSYDADNYAGALKGIDANTLGESTSFTSMGSLVRVQLSPPAKPFFRIPWYPVNHTYKYRGD